MCGTTWMRSRGAGAFGGRPSIDGHDPTRFSTPRGSAPARRAGRRPILARTTGAEVSFAEGRTLQESWRKRRKLDRALPAPNNRPGPRAVNLAQQILPRRLVRRSAQTDPARLQGRRTIATRGGVRHGVSSRRPDSRVVALDADGRTPRSAASSEKACRIDSTKSFIAEIGDRRVDGFAARGAFRSRRRCVFPVARQPFHPWRDQQRPGSRYAARTPASMADGRVAAVWRSRIWRMCARSRISPCPVRRSRNDVSALAALHRPAHRTSARKTPVISLADRRSRSASKVSSARARTTSPRSSAPGDGV